jgi:hypothetical protein
LAGTRNPCIVNILVVIAGAGVLAAQTPCLHIAVAAIGLSRDAFQASPG